MNFTPLDPDESHTAQLLIDEFKNIEYPSNRNLKQHSNRRRLAVSIPAIAAAIMASFILTSTNGGNGLSASWAATPLASPTLTVVEANLLCAERAIDIYGSRNFGTVADTIEMFGRRHQLIDERNSHAISVYDALSWSAACVLTKTDNQWKAEYFAVHGHKGERDLIWADVAYLEDESQIPFIVGMNESGEAVKITFSGNMATATVSKSDFAIWLPQSAACLPLTVERVVDGARKIDQVTFGGTDETDQTRSEDLCPAL
jgi:hypothetical protein